MKQTSLQYITLFAFLVISGCSLNKATLNTFNLTLANGDYKTAKQITLKKIGSGKSHQSLLWNLQAAALERALKNYSSSNTYFERAEQSIQYYDQQFAAGKSIQTAQGILFNDSLLPYVGKNHDRILLNTYKAINYAFLNDKANARIEFNRALQRQNDAKTLFSARAENLKNKLSTEKEKLNDERSAIDKTVNNPQLDKIIQAKYKNLDSFKVYADFINPFTTYMAGLFFWLEGDTSKAVDILKEAYAMNSGQKTILSDFTRASRAEQPENELWIIFENGLAPRREEIRIDIPILSPNIPVKYIGTAFPNLTAPKNASAYLTISHGTSKTVSTEVISDMESILAAEFKKELPGIIAREVSRVTLKTFFQYKMESEFGPLAGIAGGLYQAATTAIDLRTWSALPKDFQLAHMTIPEDRSITVHTAQKRSFPISIPSDGKNMILYIRLISPELSPIYDFIKF